MSGYVQPWGSQEPKYFCFSASNPPCSVQIMRKIPWFCGPTETPKASRKSQAGHVRPHSTAQGDGRPDGLGSFGSNFGSCGGHFVGSFLKKWMTIWKICSTFGILQRLFLQAKPSEKWGYQVSYDIFDGFVELKITRNQQAAGWCKKKKKLDLGSKTWDVSPTNIGVSVIKIWEMMSWQDLKNGSKRVGLGQFWTHDCDFFFTGQNRDLITVAYRRSSKGWAVSETQDLPVRRCPF